MSDERSFFGRLRDTFATGRPEGRKPGIAGFRPEPGPFDLPPSEPVVLEGDIPWELREDDDEATSTPPRL